MKNRYFLPLLLTTCLMLAGPPVSAEKIKVSIGGGYDDIAALTKNDVIYCSVSELATVLGGSVSWKIVGHEAVYHDDAFRFIFLLGSPFVSLNDTTFNLVFSSELSAGQLFVPAVTFVPLLDRVTPEKITWQPGNKTIEVSSEYFNVTDISIQAKANGLLIDIYLTTPLAYEIFITEGDWLNISMRDARINRNRVLSRRDSRYMYRLKVHQIENNTGQISLRLKRHINQWHHKIKYNPTRLQISIADVDFQLDTAPDRPPIGPDNKIDVIVVDAGHGGADYGAIGQKGAREKDVSLNIARKLAKMIRKDKQFQVIMTRDRDKTVSLEDRAEIANKAGADLFISIHANASAKRHVRGWNVFFLATALNDSARAVEQLENSYFLRESYDDTNTADDPFYDPVLSILNEMILTEFQVESYDFAQMVDREFRKRLDTPARGIDQAGFFVLNKVFTPSVLIEAAFISNKAEEKKLKGKKYQEKVARSLYEAIKRFKTRYEGK